MLAGKHREVIKRVWERASNTRIHKQRERQRDRDGTHGDAKEGETLLGYGLLAVWLCRNVHNLLGLFEARNESLRTFSVPSCGCHGFDRALCDCSWTVCVALSFTYTCACVAILSEPWIFLSFAWYCFSFSLCRKIRPKMTLPIFLRILALGFLE